MSRKVGGDLVGLLRGAQIVVSECVKVQEDQAKHIWRNSSLRTIANEGSKKLSIPWKNGEIKNVQHLLRESLERISMVSHGLRAVVFSGKDAFKSDSDLPVKDYLIYDNMVLKPDDIEKLLEDSYPHTESSDIYNKPLISLDDVEPVDRVLEVKSSKAVSKPEIAPGRREGGILSKRDQSVLTKSNFINPLGKNSKKSVVSGNFPETGQPSVPPAESPTVPLKTVKYKQKLSETAKERKVPSSRIERVISFGSLAAGLGLGTVAEVTRRTLGFSPSLGSPLSSSFLTPANAERIVNTLCKVRGAALKIGQLLSIQDNTVIHPVLQQAFERVRQSADFMPRYQIEAVLESQLGQNWMEHFNDFNMKPFAAASIGQVHLGELKDGSQVAVKIQYPGVAEGIDSDIENLVTVLSLWNIFPEGMFIDKLVEVAKKELSWEVDYIREAECTRKFKELLKPYPNYYVPTVIDHLCTKKIFTSELIEGIPVDKASQFDVDTRKNVCKLIMELCLMELFSFRYMQTDPNWSNFFYNPDTKKLILLDFGSTRSYDKSFIDQYIQVIKAASDGDRNKVLEMSKDMKFLTGFESKIMEEAHIDTVMILGEIFSENAGEFNFGTQQTTLRITKLVPTILSHRLCPPPEEIYSLHRKLSGVFLLCAKLNVQMACRPMFLRVYGNYS